MRRWILNLLAILSAALFIGISALWIRSYFVSDDWKYDRLDEYLTYIEGYALAVGTGRGEIGFVMVHDILPTMPGTVRIDTPHLTHKTSRPVKLHLTTRVGSDVRFAGFQWGKSPGHRFGVMPLYCPALLSLILPAIWWRRWRQR